jgi:hypothetical protein
MDAGAYIFLFRVFVNLPSRPQSSAKFLVGKCQALNDTICILDTECELAVSFKVDTF